MKTCVVILCGGIGERLWPFSTPELPKQFQCFFGEKSLLDLTLSRVDEVRPDHIVLVTNERYRTYLSEHYHSQITRGIFEILYEPCARGTSSSILYATAHLHHVLGESYKVCVLPSDHYFDEDFVPFLTSALTLSNNDREKITTFGVRPSHPDTGFGYIRHHEGSISSFHEKPSSPRAKELIEQGALWNAGIFLFYTKHLISLYQEHLPGQLSKMFSYLTHKSPVVFSSLDNTSFDCAVMEKPEWGEKQVLAYDSVWNDVGDWNRLSSLISSTPHTELSCGGNFVRSDRPVILLGVEDLVVCSTPNGILVSKKSHLDQIKVALATKSS